MMQVQNNFVLSLFVIDSIPKLLSEMREKIKNIAEKIFNKMHETYSNPICLALMGAYLLFYVVYQIAPIYTPFLFFDGRSPAEMKDKDPEKAQVLQNLTKAVHEQARMMGAPWADKINVRLGITNMAYGFRYSLGGPLLMLSQDESLSMLNKDGSSTDSAQRIIGHELTHFGISPALGCACENFCNCIVKWAFCQFI